MLKLRNRLHTSYLQDSPQYLKGLLLAQTLDFERRALNRKIAVTTTQQLLAYIPSLQPLSLRQLEAKLRTQALMEVRRMPCSVEDTDTLLA